MRTDSKREFEEGEMTLYIIFYTLKCVCELAEAVNVKNRQTKFLRISLKLNTLLTELR